MAGGGLQPYPTGHRSGDGAGAGGPHPRDKQKKRTDTQQVGPGTEGSSRGGRGAAVSNPPQGGPLPQ